MPKMKDEDIIKNECYRSILNLFIHCGKNGLTHAQILYALSKKPKEDEEIKKFYDSFNFGLSKDKKFIDFYRPLKYTIDGKKKSYSELTRCISGKNKAKKLNDRLDLLISRGWIKPEGKKRYYTYYLTNKYNLDIQKRDIKRMLNEYTDRETYDKFMLKTYLNAFINPEKIEYPYILSTKERSNWILFGLPLELLVKLSIEEKKNLDKWLDEIEKNLWNIMELKYSKQKISGDKIREGLDKHDDTLFQDFINKGLSYDHINFYYNGYKFMSD